ncbi:unnamed protein product [Fusarium fujikuroi]|uniref:Uncharacterized protein n=1 Tax=Fusarium fujikuroi TaxID=5127 RepID=A0A9Q9RX33_FUSFU|nr:unnamed protein product [Fusarium fujikuroi]
MPIYLLIGKFKTGSISRQKEEKSFLLTGLYIKVLKERICKIYPKIATYLKSAKAINRLIIAIKEL